MGELAESVIEMAMAIAAAVLVFRAICAAPVLTLVALALAGMALQEHLVRVPESALAQRIDEAQAEVHRTQRDRAETLSCQARTFRALWREDDAALPSARDCPAR